MGYYTLIVEDVDALTIKTYADILGDTNSILIFEHDPQKENFEDPSHIACTEHPNFHFHIIVGFTGDRWDNNTHITKFRTSLREHTDHIKGQRVFQVRSLLTYCMIPPRKLIFEKHGLPGLREELTTITPLMVEEMAHRKRETRQSKQLEPGAISFLADMIKKYNVNSQTQLLDSTKDTSDYAHIKSEYVKRNFNHNLEKAFQLVQLETISMNTLSLAQRWLQQPGETEQFYSLQESESILSKWCLFQNINPTRFALAVIHILDRAFKKKNTLYLQGESNSGKTFVTEPLKHLCTYYGEVNQGTAGYQFMYQDCINKRCIFINEPYFDVAAIEQLKIVLEGTGTFVHVKMRKDDWLRPTPVIITANTEIWRYAQTEEQAIRNRMIAFENLKKCDFLVDYKKTLHPAVFTKIAADEGFIDIDLTPTDELDCTFPLQTILKKAATLFLRTGKDFLRYDALDVDIDKIITIKITEGSKNFSQESPLKAKKRLSFERNEELKTSLKIKRNCSEAQHYQGISSDDD